jgi:hypothetical protein
MTRRKSNFELPIRIDYQPPSGLLHFITLTHTTAIISFFVVAVPIWVRCLLCLGVVVSYFYQRDIYHCAKLKPVRVNLNASNEWQCISSQDELQFLQLQGRPFVHPGLIIMRFKNGHGKQIKVILTRGNCEPVTHRRLRVRLRFHESRPGDIRA